MVGVGGCRKFVQVNPPSTTVVSTSVYSNDASASSAMLGLYNSITSQPRFSNSFDVYAGLQADELTNYNVSNAAYVQFYTNSLISTNAPFWSELYNIVFVANSILEGLKGSTGLSAKVKTQLTGEARFVRAFFYFYMVNLWGDIPLITSASDYSANNTAARASKDSVYAQVVTDLVAAKTLLSTSFLGADAATPSVQRTRPTKWAAGALLARVYLYRGQWQQAEAEADTVIANAAQFSLLTDLTQVFLANSNEAIWQLQPTTAGYNTIEAFNFILTNIPGTGTAWVTLSGRLDSAFEPGDRRYVNWVGSFTNGGNTWYYPYKYKVNAGATTLSEYLMVLRLAEQYLIRAEARAQQNKIDGTDGALADINVLRVRAGLPTYPTGLGQALILADIMHERRVELFTEWGHRWLDLVRTQQVDTIMGPPENYLQQKGGAIWNSDNVLYPLPQTDLLLDANLKQNTGY